mgnify:FL=1
MIAEFPIEEWHGGKVRYIVRDKVILLERGQVFDINGKTFFTFWGASSHDVQGGILNRNDCDFDYERRKAIDRGLPFRIVHESWWPQELPNEEEMEEGRRNLEFVSIIPAEVRLLRLLEDIWHQMCFKVIRRGQKQNHRLIRMLSVL